MPSYGFTTEGIGYTIGLLISAGVVYGSDFSLHDRAWWLNRLYVRGIFTWVLGIWRVQFPYLCVTARSAVKGHPLIS
jgi:hypothetical protein